MSDHAELSLQILTPSKKMVEAKVTHVVLPGYDGELGILPSHTPLLVELGFGVLWFEHEGKKRFLAIEGGIGRIQDNCVTVLADSAEDAEQIDVERAKKALERAMERRKGAMAGEITDVDRAEKAALRALTRLEASARMQIGAHN